MNLILFVLATIGLTNIVVESTIFAPIRELAKKFLPNYLSKVFDCFQCSGFYSGLICSFIFITHDPLFIVGCGFAGSFLAVFGNVFINYLEARTIVFMGEDSKQAGDKDGQQTV